MAFVLIYLSLQHIIRMITNFGGWEMDITTYTMMLTTKLSALSFAYSDGTRNEIELTKEQKERKIVEMPSVLELLSYSYFCCGCLVGPFFEYSDYIQFIKEEGRYKDIPSTFLPSMERFLKGKCKIHK